MKLEEFRKAGHWPTLLAAFLYFAFSCCIWVLNGALAPFISEAYNLTPAQKGLMLSIPIMAGALMRFPLGILSQYIGRKNATLVEMGLIAAMLMQRFRLEWPEGEPWPEGDLAVTLRPAQAIRLKLHPRAAITPTQEG